MSDCTAQCLQVGRLCSAEDNLASYCSCACNDQPSAFPHLDLIPVHR